MPMHIRVCPQRVSIFRQLRFYSAKAALKPQSEDALKVWEELEALDLQDPKQLFDDNVVSKESTEEYGDDGPSNLPVSPIMDAKSWKRRFKTEPKLRKRHPSEMTERELQLMKSPYANALATSTRLEGFFMRSLPSFFLQRMKILVHPETKDPWILPFGIKSKHAAKQVSGTSKFIGANYITMDFLKSKRWKKLLDPKFAIFGVWRSDMADFVLGQLQQRAYEEVANSQRCIMSAGKEGGKWEDLDIGCLLVWETAPSKPQSSDTVADTGDNSNAEDYTKQASKSEGPARTLVRVKDKLVPRYNMAALLGSDKAAELKKQLKIEDIVQQSAVVVSARTMKTQMWLWKLAGYRRQNGTSLFPPSSIN